MKKLTTILLLTIISVSVKAGFMKNDTTTIEFNDKGVKKRVTVYTSGKKDFDLPKNLNLDNLLQNIGVDSTERKRALVLIGQDGNKQDTILVVSQDGKKIKIVTKDPSDTFAKADTTRPTAKEQEKWSRDERDDDENDDDDDDDDKKTYHPKKKGNGRFFSRSDFGIYVGLNGWMKEPATAAATLSTWRSRYVALSWRKNATLINGKQVDLAFSYGPEIAWNNFMFEGNNVASWDGKQVSFGELKTNEKLEKSKLVVPTVNFPMMLNFGFDESKFQMGFGGYVGYRIGGYTKQKFSDGGKEHLKGRYGLEDFKYGLTAEVGRKNGLKFFFRYDMVPMFKNTQLAAKDLQSWSAGVRL